MGFSASLLTRESPASGERRLAEAIQSRRGNAALKLEGILKKDKSVRRFSMISIDGDVQANIKAIQIQVRQDNIVGSVAVHKPDFEFANFTIQEPVEVTALLDSAGRAFEKQYRRISERKPATLKGEEWGRALAKYMDEHPQRSDTGRIRPVSHEIRAAVHGWISNYDAHKEHFTIDPITLGTNSTKPA
jgi:hypothetical protein